MKYNLSKIMLKAWKVYRKTKNISFAEALHRAWLSAKAEEINVNVLKTRSRQQESLKRRILLLNGKNWDIKWFMVLRHYLDAR